MKSAPMILPWTADSVPHALLDILRGCNIRCRDCFNAPGGRIKPLAEVEHELETLLRLRPLQSVAIIGGEVTLHPQLEEIVRMVRRRRLFAEIFTNGVALDRALAERLAAAGANLVFLHIEHGQHRPDLPENPTPEALHRLRAEKAELITQCGMEAGLAVTLYPERWEELEEAVRFTLESPHVTYLLGTLWRDVARMPSLSGNMETGIVADRAGDFAAQKDVLNNEQIAAFLEERFGLTPFASVGSNVDAKALRWLSYFIATVHEKGWRSLRATCVEKLFLALSRRFTGRYPFYQPQNARRLAFQLLYNGHVSFLSRKMLSKRLLFQNPAEIGEDGKLIYCNACPDAVLKNGALVPVCISDQMI